SRSRGIPENSSQVSTVFLLSCFGGWQASALVQRASCSCTSDTVTSLTCSGRMPGLNCTCRYGKLEVGSCNTELDPNFSREKSYKVEGFNCVLGFWFRTFCPNISAVTTKSLASSLSRTRSYWGIAPISTSNSVWSPIWPRFRILAVCSTGLLLGACCCRVYGTCFAPS